MISANAKSVPHVSNSVASGQRRSKRSENSQIQDLSQKSKERSDDEPQTKSVKNDENKNEGHSRKVVRLYQPSCSETTLSTRLAALFTKRNWEGRCFGLVPSRIGHYRSLDMAVTAYLEVVMPTANQSSSARTNAVRLYVDAIRSVKTKMSRKSFWSTEEAQLAVTILAAYESTKGSSLKYMLAHKQGLHALLLQSTHVTEVVRATAYDESMGAYLVSCARGEPSQFDSEFWLDLEPISGQAPTMALASLRKIAYRFSIRLPGLIVLVRNLENRMLDPRAMSRAIKLACDLAAEKDEQAESKLLHTVQVIKLRQPAHAHVVLFGLRFKSLPECEAAIYYWQTRIVLNRLCARLQTFLPGRQYFDLHKIVEENSRMAANLLMIWEAILEHAAFGTSRGGPGSMVYAYSMIAVWGVLLDVETFMGHDSCETRASVLEGMQILTNRGINTISEAQMNEMADLFAGGPVQGLLPYFVDLRPG